MTPLAILQQLNELLKNGPGTTTSRLVIIYLGVIGSLVYNQVDKMVTRLERIDQKILVEDERDRRRDERLADIESGVSFLSNRLDSQNERVLRLELTSRN